jgi:ankyrin repeat protein
MVHYLLKLNDDAIDSMDHFELNTRNLYGFSPLFYACINGHQDLVRILVSYGAYAQPDPGILHAAAYSDSLSQLDWNPYRDLYPDSYTILHVGCEVSAKNTSLLAILIEADPVLTQVMLDDSYSVGTIN